MSFSKNNTLMRVDHPLSYVIKNVALIESMKAKTATITAITIKKAVT